MDNSWNKTIALLCKIKILKKKKRKQIKIPGFIFFIKFKC